MKLGCEAMHEMPGGYWLQTAEQFMEAKEIVTSGCDLQSHVGLKI